MISSNRNLLCVIFLALTLFGCSRSEVLERYENGNIKVEAEFKDGLLHGVQKSYYEDGSLKSSGVYLHDKKNSVFEYYYESGKLKQRVNYLNDFKLGTLKDYYISGELKAETEFVLDTINGSLTRYFKNGDIEFKGIFHKGEVSSYEQFDSLGILTDWKMELLITHELKDDNILHLNFDLKNKKFDIMRIEIVVYQGEDLVARADDNSDETKIQSIFKLPDNNLEYTFLGKVLDIEIPPDSKDGVIRNVDSFEYVIR